MRWTEDDLADLQKRRSGVRSSVSRPRDLALGRMPAGKMNKTESAYDAHLWQLRHTGRVLWHKFEGVKLRLADNTFLTVDFVVLPASGVLEMREVKGFMREDAAVKLRIAADMYPFRFILVRKKGDGWSETEVRVAN